MSVSDAAALTTRSRSRSSSKALLHIHPEEELTKHDSAGGHPPKSTLDNIPSITTRSHTADHHHHHHHHHHHQPADISKDTLGSLDPSTTATRSRSRSKLAPVNSSIREPTVSLSTHRVLSYGPSGDDLVHQRSGDTIHSLDGVSAHSTDSQSSSKTIPQEHDSGEMQEDANVKPSSPLLENAASFFTKDVFIHIVCSLLVLGFVVIAVSHVGMPASQHLLRTLKSMNMWRPPLATSQQVQELKEHLMITLKVSTERLEERVEGLKAEVREEMRRQKEEAEDRLLEDIGKDKQANDISEDDESMKHTHTHGLGYGGHVLGDLGAAVGGSGRPDYALASGGGRVIGHSPAYKPTSSTPSWVDKLPAFFIRAPRIHPLAHIILQPSFNQPGQCLPLASSAVHVEVALRTPIYADQVTLSHVSKSIAYDISSAPKEFQIYGLAPPLSTSKPASWILMGEFTYDVHKVVAAQAFELWETAKTTLISTLKLQVLSNYGSPSHTCIYRLQVHGKEPTT